MASAHKLTAQQRMADAILRDLDTDLKAFLGELHSAGQSYETIGRELYLKTEGAVSPSFGTIKRWLIDFDILEEAS